MPLAGTEFSRLLGVARNNDLYWKDAKETVTWEKLERSKKWEVALPGIGLTILILSVVVHK